MNPQKAYRPRRLPRAAPFTHTGTRASRERSWPGAACAFLPASRGTNTDLQYTKHGIRRKRVLKLHRNPYAAVESIMHWDHLSLDEAVEAVRAAGGKVEQRYVDNFRRLQAKAKRATQSE